MRCIAVDDEPLALKQLETYIRKEPGLELLALCQSAAEARKVLETNDVDAMFLDINMPDESGMDFVKSLANPPMVVFTTAYSEFAVEGYKIDAVDYLLKPFSQSDFHKAVVKMNKQYDLVSAAAVSSVDQDDAMFFKTDYKVVRVETSKIIYVEGMSEYLKIYVEDSDPVIVLLSMKKLEEHLPSDRFMRIHKSYILNLRKIREVSKNRVLISTGVSIPVGDLYRENFQKYLDSKFLGK